MNTVKLGQEQSKILAWRICWSLEYKLAQWKLNICYIGSRPTCRCQFQGPATFECLWKARGCRPSRWCCCFCRSWGTEWESGPQDPQPHRCEKSISWVQLKEKEKENGLALCETHTAVKRQIVWLGHTCRLLDDELADIQSTTRLPVLPFFCHSTLQHLPLLHSRYKAHYYTRWM